MQGEFVPLRPQPEKWQPTKVVVPLPRRIAWLPVFSTGQNPQLLNFTGPWFSGPILTVDMNWQFVKATRHGPGWHRFARQAG